MKALVYCCLFACLLLAGGWPLYAQTIVQGPAFGAMTHQSAKVYLRTLKPATLKIEWTADSLFTTVNSTVGQSRQLLDNSVILSITGLQPDTKYYYRLFADGVQDTITAWFRTFPAPGQRGDFTFVTGSCQETENMKVFNAIPLNQPYFLLHTGDFTYPDYQIAPDYSAHYQKIAYSYQKKYDEKVMKQMLHTIPIDYIYDDNDYVGGSGGRYVKDYNSQNSMLFFNTENKIWTDSFPDFWRGNCIKGYMDFFPGYEMVDTSNGIFHSFKFGNAEFFFLDRCANTPHGNSYGFKWDGKRKKFTYEPADDHVLFGKVQMDWLKNGLKNSTADWKFIVSGVPLNRNIQILINAGLRLQNIGWKDNNGFRLATGFTQYWAGHPAEINDFYDWLGKENVKDIVVISGDTHHNVMDDGRNAGLPELNASGMSVTETYLAYYLKVIGNITGQFNLKKQVWNQGGQGFGNRNFKNGFGKVRIVNNEYVELAIIDEDNELVSSFKVNHSSTPKGARHQKKLNY
ncbi:hypothetical protein BH09BAC1_BH09BAC1_20150 [soil metagenome]